MSQKTTLAPATELAAKSPVRFPNETAEYRSARTALLAEEIELRRHIERVSAQRRALPPGGPVPDGYTFITENGPRTFADLFGDKQTLVLYSYMFGPQRERPCPVCTSLLSAWDGTARNVTQLIAFGIVKLGAHPLPNRQRTLPGSSLVRCGFRTECPYPPWSRKSSSN